MDKKRMRDRCPNCGDLLINPSGPQSSPYLFVGEFPGMEEIRQGNTFVGITGSILNRELARIGLQLSACRSINLWQHAKNDCDLEFHINKLTQEIRKHKYVLLMGSDVTQVLLGKNVMDISGMKVKIALFPKIVFYASPNPAILLHAPIGEFRLALQRFKKEIK
jgi:uracil-DNA glycosylase family 4